MDLLRKLGTSKSDPTNILRFTTHGLNCRNDAPTNMALAGRSTSTNSQSNRSQKPKPSWRKPSRNSAALASFSFCFGVLLTLLLIGVLSATHKGGSSDHKKTIIITEGVAI